MAPKVITSAPQKREEPPPKDSHKEISKEPIK